MRSFLESRPIPTAVIYTVVGVLPLYLSSAQAVRLQQELGFGKTSFGIMVACFYLVSSVASLGLGPQIDRRGPTPAFRIAGLLSLSSSILIAVAANRWETFGVFLGIAGLANAFGQLGSNVAVTDTVRDTRQGIAFAAKQAAVPTGAMLAGLAVPWVGGTLSWRWVFVGAAAVALLVTVVSPRYEHTPQVAPRTRITLTPALVALMIAAALAGGTGNAVASFVVDAAVSTGLTEASAAHLLTVASIVAILSRLTCGMVIDRRRSSGVVEATALLTLAVAGLLTLATSGSAVAPFLVGTLLSFAGAWGWPGVMQYLTIRLIDMPAATATGATLAAGFLGTVVIPPLFGAAAENLSYGAAFLGLTGVVVAALAAVHVSRRLARVTQPAR